MLSSEASAAPGPWRTLAFQREALDAMAPGSPYQQVVLVWASQVGKSELWLTLLSYILRALSFTVRRESHDVRQAGA